jgi:hypothetical protein
MARPTPSPTAPSLVVPVVPARPVTRPPPGALAAKVAAPNWTHPHPVPSVVVPLSAGPVGPAATVVPPPELLAVLAGPVAWARTPATRPVRAASAAMAATAARFPAAPAAKVATASVSSAQPAHLARPVKTLYTRGDRGPGETLGRGLRLRPLAYTQYATRARYWRIAKAATTQPITVSPITTAQCRSSWCEPSSGARTISR